MKVLITSGATREPIDSVRFITNFSTGGTGAELADELIRVGAEVTYLAGQGAKLPIGKSEIIHFTDFKDLEAALKALLGEREFDLILHLAAVSDYSVASVESGGDPVSDSVRERKLSSDAPELTIHLKRNPKLIAQLADFAWPRRPRIVGFKLTSTSDPAERDRAIARVARTPGVDLVVHNDYGEIRSGEQRFSIYREGSVSGSYDSRAALARELIRWMGVDR